MYDVFPFLPECTGLGFRWHGKKLTDLFEKHVSRSFFLNFYQRLYEQIPPEFCRFFINRMNAIGTPNKEVSLKNDFPIVDLLIHKVNRRARLSTVSQKHPKA